MDINVRNRSGVHLIQLKGDLKIGAPVDEFRRTMDELFGAGEARFVVDLQAVPMVDSSGIGALVRSLTSAKQRGGSLKLLSPSRLAVQTLKIVGLLNLFEVFDDENQAFASFR